MILPISRMRAQIASLEERADKALEQRTKLTALVEQLKGRVETLENKGTPK
jgi:hypothetical protein